MLLNFFKKLKRSVWGINLVGSGGSSGKNDLEFGMTDNFEPAIKLGDKIVTPDTIGGNKAFDSITKVNDYLYEIEYEDYDREYAEKYFKAGGKPFQFACSSVRNGNWYGRNFDWYYDHSVEFVVRISSSKGRKASIGMSGAAPGFTRDTVESGEFLTEYKILPFFLVDGINEDGVFCNTNVVPSKGGGFVTTIPTDEKRGEICEMEVVRHILDNYSTAHDAVNDIAEHLSVYAYEPLNNMHYDLHVMVGDVNDTYLMEFIDGAVVVTKMNDASGAGEIPPYMTNFHLYGVELNADDTVYTPSTQDDDHNAIITNHIEDFGAGLERYNLITENYSSCGSKDGMMDLMTNVLKYTNAYDSDQDPVWYTEFVGARNLTVASTPEEYAPVMDIVYDMFEHRSRDRGHETWQTVHTAVYDISQRKLYVHNQEGDVEYAFDINKYYSSSDIDEMVLPKVTSADNGKILKVVDGEWKVVNP